MKRKLLGLLLVVFLFVLGCPKAVDAVSVEDGYIEDASFTSAKDIKVKYRSHVSGIGWQAYVSGNDVSGTVGQGRAIEAIQLSVSGIKDLGVRYRVYGQGYGWQNWTKKNEMAGTVGQAKRLEAIQIELTGKQAKNYDIYYRVHAQSYGWLGWTKNGKSAGTIGISKRLEAVQIRIKKKGSKGLSSEQKPCITEKRVTYKSFSQDLGWQPEVGNGAVSGVTGKAKRLESFRVSLPDSKKLGIKYSAYVQGIGWNDYVKDGAACGKAGSGKRIEAVKLALYGSDADLYSVWYRVHVQGYGWLGWACDDQIAGSEGQSRRVEAIQIRVLPRKAAAPGSTKNAQLPTSRASMLARQTLDSIGWDLRRAYNYSAGLRYYRNVAIPPAGHHLEKYAEYGFTNKCGNCYVMAATFCQMARELGYECYLVEGWVPRRGGGITVHGWTEIVVDGKTYVCDPNFTNETGGNGYMINYGNRGTWIYQKYSRVNE